MRIYIALYKKIIKIKYNNVKKSFIIWFLLIQDLKMDLHFLITHSQREAYMDSVENGGGGGGRGCGRQEIEEPQGM